VHSLINLSIYLFIVSTTSSALAGEGERGRTVGGAIIVPFSHSCKF